MSNWAAITADDVLSELQPQERAQMIAIAGPGAPDSLLVILARVIAEVRGYIRSGGYPLDEENPTFIPLELANDAIAISRWRYLNTLPVKILLTKERVEAKDAAIEKLKLVAKQEFKIESPTAAPSANPPGAWNSENKLIGRMHPIPAPGVQFPPSPGYSDPTAPEDNTQ